MRKMIVAAAAACAVGSAGAVTVSVDTYNETPWQIYALSSSTSIDHGVAPMAYDGEPGLGQAQGFEFDYSMTVTQPKARTLAYGDPPAGDTYGPDFTFAMGSGFTLADVLQRVPGCLVAGCHPAQPAQGNARPRFIVMGDVPETGHAIVFGGCMDSYCSRPPYLIQASALDPITAPVPEPPIWAVLVGGIGWMLWMRHISRSSAA